MDYSDIVAKITPSIAKILCLNSETNSLSTGSGFIYKKKGIVVTCEHVIVTEQSKSGSVFCKFSDDPEGQIFPAKVVLRDSEHDLALLKIDSDRMPLESASNEALKNIRPGAPVLFSGYPLNMEALTTHQGMLSSVTTDAVGATTYLIDGTVNSGNSGCPLMNANGEVLGVVNAKQRQQSDLLKRVEGMALGALSLHGIDLVEIYQALISNTQLGIGYAVPASYIPEHKEITKTTGQTIGAAPAATLRKPVKGKK